MVCSNSGGANGSGFGGIVHIPSCGALFSEGSANALRSFVQISIGGMILFNYPLTLFGAVQSMELLIWGSDEHYVSPFGGYFVDVKRALHRTSWVVLTGLVAL